MKKLYLLSLLAMLGCSSNETKIEENETFKALDSVIEQNKKNIVTVDIASKKSDSSITKKIEKTVKQINILKEENKQLKKENNDLKIKLNDATDVGKPFKLLPVSNGEDNR